MNKKGKILVIALATAVMILALIILLPKNKPGHNPGQTGDKGQVNNQKTTDDKLKSAIIGTWYSNVPDSLTFNIDGTYKGGSWKGNSPWLISGTYTVDGHTITLSSLLDGTATLNISDTGDILSNHTYTYYKTAELAEEAIKQAQEEKEKEEQEKKHIPNIIEKLKGVWVDSYSYSNPDNTFNYTESTYTENTFEIRLYGREKIEGQKPEKTEKYEYEIISDTVMKVKKEGADGWGRYHYSIREDDGKLILSSPVITFGPKVYIKVQD